VVLALCVLGHRALAGEPAAAPDAAPAAAPDALPDAAPTAAPAEPEAQTASAEPPAASKRAYLLDRLAAGASLGYFTAQSARVLSEIHFDFPFIVLQQQSIYVRGTFETSTVKTGNRLRTDSFQAQDIEYLVEAGARDYLSNRVAIAAFLGQQGRRQLDGQQSSGATRPEGSSLRYVGVGFESAGFPRPGENRFEWRLAAGVVLHPENVQADAVVRGAVLYDVWRVGKSSIGIDASFDSLFDGLSGQTEYRAGPRWTFPLPNGVRATLFAEWIRGNNPLLLDTLQGWNYGFRYTEGAYAGPHTQILPDVTGVLSFGRGSERGFGRLDLDLSSPEIHLLSKPGRFFANLDANVVGGTGTDNLYYVATLGIEATLAPKVVFGPYIYHRSNHTLGGDPNNSTTLNIVQLSARTPGWEYTNRLPGALMPDTSGGWLGRIEGCLVPGVVTNSGYTNARSWDLQAGARVDLRPRDRALVPFIRVFGEWGGVDRIDRREISTGFTTRQNLVVEVRYRRDSQYFGEDDKDVFLAVSLYF
jgi:hypothetical protein